MDEGRKRVLAIVAGILVVRHLKTPEDLGDSRLSPRTENLISSAVQWADRIVNKIDGVFGNSSGNGKTMAANLGETLISVWRQVLVEDAKTVALGGKSYLVRHTSRSKLREVDFRFENQTLRGLEQNPSPGSRWAELARTGKKVTQFLDSGRYVANVADGEGNFYGRKQRPG